MAKPFNQWIDDTKNKYWDMDGAYGAQCWDLWAKYSMEQWGMSLQDCITPTGWAGGLTSAYPISARQGDVYELKNNTWTPQAGDVAVWQACGDYPYTHVAIVVGGIVADGIINVITQNPEASEVKNMPLAKPYIAYLHPKAYGDGGANTGDNKPTGGNTASGGNTTGSTQTGVTHEYGAWIQQAGDNLYLHETKSTGGKTRTFKKTTAQNWLESGKGNPQHDDGANTGQGVPSVGDWDGDAEAMYALYVIGTIESGLNWAAVEPNRQGIGIAQWSFGRRLELLQAMRDADADGWDTFKQAAPDLASLVESGGDFTRPLTDTETDAFKTFAARTQSRKGQKNRFGADWQEYPKPYGNAKMDILYNAAYHQSPASAQNIPQATTLDGLYANIMATPPFGSYINRYQTARNLLTSWNGTNMPPNF